MNTTMNDKYTGAQDVQSVNHGGHRLPSKIHGVRFFSLKNVLTKSGIHMEIFRKDWDESDISVQQINWVELNPNAITDWHLHKKQTDRLIGVGGNIKLVLLDGRKDSPTYGVSEVIRFGVADPIMVIFPPGIWHALKNESGMSSGYLNVIDELYDYVTPDNFRAAFDDIIFPNL